jgi:formate hydrogenlyase subunit 3/multisubunit Na+/H+ antiporter MnhD subunit
VSPLELVLAALAALALSAVLPLALGRRATGGAVLIAWVGCAVGLGGALIALLGGAGGTLAADWAIPGGALVVGLDPLSAVFLAPLFALGALCALYGPSYLGPRPVAAGLLHALLAAMVLVLLARQAVLFLVAWEAMTLLAYLLITVDHGDAEVRRAGWVYLIFAHVATLALIAMFLALAARAGGALDFDAFAGATSAPASAGVAGAPAGLVLGLALLGFGVKAGVVGLHVWLPEAHAAAPSHVSGLMSGVLIKLGVYGLLRVGLLVGPVPWLGPVLALLGVAGALLGITLALYQRDLKRVLAYSSVENVGIILLALGLGLWARERGDAALAALALGGGLLHVWNHAAMKGLLFLGAGSVVHGAGTKDIERLGGLAHAMPWTGRALVVGALAIAALPPFAGFAGEWVIYRALAAVAVHGAPAAALGALGASAALALVGGLAALCFVRLVGVVLLGAPRSAGAARAHESPLGMVAPLVVLAAACLVGGLAAPALLTALRLPLAQLGATDGTAAAAAAEPVARVSLALLVVAAGGAALVAARARRVATSDDTWGCGYAAPTPRMQYTGRGFAELFSARVLPRWARARLRTRAPEGLFPAAASFASDATDPLTRAAYEPLLSRLGAAFARLRFLQQGNVHIYILYIVATAILGLAWVAARDSFGAP